MRRPLRQRPARWIAIGLTAGGLVLSPLAAAATGLAADPEPPTWPTVAIPDESTGGGSSDPEPVDQPTVEKPDDGGANDPEPETWPAPTTE